MANQSLMAAPYVYTANLNSTVSIIDTATDSVAGTITLPVNSKPDHICLNPVSATAYTLSSFSNKVSVIDTVTNTVVTTISDPAFTGLTTIACNPSGTRVYVANNDTATGTATLYYIDTATNSVLASSLVVGTDPGSIVFNRNGSTAYLLNQGVPSISVIDTVSSSISRTITLDPADGPSMLAIHTDDSKLYVLNSAAASVSLLEAATGNEIARINVVSNFVANTMAVSNLTNLLYIGTIYPDQVSVANPDTYQVVETFSTNSPQAVLERNDGKRVYIVSMVDDVDNIRSYDTLNLTAPPTPVALPAGSSPQAFATLLGTRQRLTAYATGDGDGALNWPFNFSMPASTTGSVMVPEGVAVTATATAGTCSTVDWTGCDQVTGGGTQTAACSVNPLSADKAVNAVFSLKNFHNITVTVPGGHGTVTCVSPACDGSASLCTITPDAGYQLSLLTDNGANVMGAVIGGTAYQIANVAADHAVVARFDNNSYTVTPSIGVGSGNGTLSPSGAQTVTHNGTASFTITPNSGYTASVTGSCGGVLNGSTYTTNPVSANCSVIANFGQSTRTVTATAGANGSVSPASQTIVFGAGASVSLIPATGYHIVTPVGGICGGSLSGNSYTIAAVYADCTVNAAFSINQYNVNFTPGSNGTLSGATSQTVSYGASSSAVTAVPASGYHFVNWTVAGVPVSISNPLTITSVTASQDLTANFAINSYSVTPSAGSNGAVVPGVVQTVSHGNTASFTLTPAAGYHVVTPVGGSCGGTLTGTTYTTNAVTDSCTVDATFANSPPTANAQVLNTPENQALAITLTGSDTDGSSLSYYTTALPAHGSLTGSVPNLSYTPATGYVGSDSFTFAVNDGTYDSAPATISINVIQVTHAVNFASGGNGSLSGSTSQTVNWNGNTNSNPVTAVPSPGYQFVNWTGTGGFLTSTANPLTISSVTADMTITANFANSAPSANAQVLSTPENQALAITLGGSDSEGSVLTYTVTSAPAHGVLSGSAPSLTYTPAGGYVGSDSFTFTVSDGSNSSAPATVTINVTQVTQTVSFTSGGNGTLSGSASQAVNWNANTSAISAVPAIGYHFVNWTGTNGFVTSTANPLTVSNVTANMTITANFAIDTFVFNFTSGGNGTLSGTAFQTVNYAANTSAVSAVPATGYHFVNWTGDNGFFTTTTNPLTVNGVTAGHSITANFEIDSYIVTPGIAVGIGHGTISPGVQTVVYNGTASFTVTPEIGYTASVSGTCGGNLSVTTYTTNPVSANCTVIANFDLDTRNVTASAGTNGSASPANQTVVFGASASVTLTPASGYHIVTPVGGSCGGSLSGNVYTTNAVTVPCTVDATFANSPPTANAQVLSTPENQALAITLTGSDPEGSSLSYSTATPPAHGVLSGSAPNLTYTPASGYVGNDSFTFTVSDGTNSSAPSTVTINMTQVTQAVSFTSSGNGTLSGATSQTVNWNAGTTAVTASANTGYHFVNWTVGGVPVSTNNPLTVSNVTTDMTITANFAIDTFVVNFTSGGNGGVSGDAGQTVTYGANASAVTATPVAGYHFVNWTGTGGFVVTTANPLIVSNVTSDMTITANFSNSAPSANGQGVSTPENQALDITLSGSDPEGSILSYTIASAPAHGALSGSAPNLTYTPASGYVGNDSFTFTVSDGTNSSAPATVSISISQVTKSVNFISGGNGMLSGATSQTVNLNGNTSAVSAVPGVGYHFVNWTVGGVLVSTNNPLTVSNITTDMTITANFAIDTFVVNFTSGGNGSLSGSTPQTVNWNAGTSAVTAIPASGYHFVNWTGDNGFVTTTANPLTVNGVTSDKNITANFAIDTFAVNFTSGGNGTFTGKTSQTINYGSQTDEVTAVPSPFYHFVNWTANGVVVSTNNPLTITKVTSAQDITANFALDSYAITTTPGSGGSIAPAAVSATHGTTASFTVTSNPGYAIVSVSGCGGALSGSTYSTGQITGSCSISAVFAPNTYNITTTVQGGNGTISCASPVSQGVASGCTIIPNSGYHLASLSDNGVDVLGLVANKNSYGANNVVSNHQITATFVPYSVGDALLALKAAIGLTVPTTGDKVWADVAPLDANQKPKGDGMINISDALMLLHRTIGNYNW